MGTKMTPAGFDGNGAGFDVADLQIYNGLLAESDLLFLANNPGFTINPVPEPSSIALLGLGVLAIAVRRVRNSSKS